MFWEGGKDTMKRASRIALMMCLVLIVSVAIPVRFNDNSDDISSKVKAIDIDLSAYDNEMNIVEIVPYAGYSEMAYFVGGSEPIDLYKVSKDPSEGQNMIYLLKSYMKNGDCYGQEAISDLLLDGKTYYVTYNLEVFKRYVLLMNIDTNILKKVAVLDFLNREIDSGKLTSNQLNNVQKKINEYQLTTKEMDEYNAFNSFKVKVTTIISSKLNDMTISQRDIDDPSQVTNREKKALLNADMINILHRSTVGSMNRIDPFIMDELKNGDGAIEGFKGKYEPSWSVVSYIFKRATNLSKRLPVIMPKELEGSQYYASTDAKTVKPYQTYLTEQSGAIVCKSAVQGDQGTGICNNVFKLYLLLYQLNAYYYRDRFFPYIDDSGSFSAAAGPDQPDAANYWNVNTFYNARYNSVTEKWEATPYNDKMNYGIFSVTLFNCGYIYNTDNNMNQNLLLNQFVIRDSNGNPLPADDQGTVYNNNTRFTSDIYEYFVPAGDFLNLTGANVLQYLLFNTGLEKENVTVLEIEPSNGFTLSEETVRSWLLKYSTENNVTIVRKTVEELNSTYENLVASYDLIYIGNNVSAYNSTALGNKSFVSNTGESIVSENSVKQTYSGNDITPSRLTDLKDYYNQGLPVVFAEALYKDLKGKTATSTNLYQFFNSFGDVLVNDQIFGEHEFDLAPTATVKRLSNYMKLERPGIEVYDSSLTTDSLTVKYLLDGASMKRKLQYTAYLYADTDGDGRVESTPYKQQAVVNHSGTLSMTWSKDYPPCALYRVYVKADVEGTKNPHTSETYGMVEKNVKETVRVLQIDANSNSTADLTNRSSAITEVMSRIISKYEFKVTRLTASQYVELFNNNSFDSDDDTYSDQLLNYDVVVLGLAKDYPVIDNSKGAVNNLIAFLKRGKSVVFTSGVLDYRSNYGNTKTKEAYQTLRTLAGMSSDSTSGLFTYGYLNKKGFSSVPSKGSHYNITLNSEAFVTGAATKVNNGQVTRFPFNIEGNDLTQDTGQEKRFKALTSDRLKAEYGDYRLNIKDNSITGYYALSNTDLNGRKLYSVSPNDIEDNYYLYTKGGNAWYCGIGNETLSINYPSDVKVCELFVNTLVAAYTNAEASPVVEFRKSQTDNLGNSFLQIGFDVNSETENGEIIAYFVSTDENGLDMTTSLFIGDKNGPDTTKKLVTVNEVDQSTIMIKKSGIKYNTGTTKLKSGTIYAVILDKSQMGMNSNMYLYVYANNGTNVGMNRLLLDRRNDFNLR